MCLLVGVCDSSCQLGCPVLCRQLAKHQVGEKLITNVDADVEHSAHATSTAAVQLAGTLNLLSGSGKAGLLSASC